LHRREAECGAVPVVPNDKLHRSVAQAAMAIVKEDLSQRLHPTSRQAGGDADGVTKSPLQVPLHRFTFASFPGRINEGPVQSDLLCDQKALEMNWPNLLLVVPSNVLFNNQR
jgi:hypothetical protein